MVWAFSKFVIILKTTICEKLIDTLLYGEMGTEYFTKSEIQKPLLKEKLQHDIITVYTDI